MQTKHLPGYTGHIPEPIPVQQGVGQTEPRSHIPNYQGYIPSVKAENLFGETYGKTTYKSSARAFPRGLDVDPHQKYISMQREQYIDLSTVREKTATEMLGVQPRPGPNLTVIPIETYNRFWGIEDDSVSLANNATAFYGQYSDQEMGQMGSLSFEADKALFFGQFEGERPVKLGEPVPGYTGVSRRVVADNVFGMTYANSRKMAGEELQVQDNDRADVLRGRAVFVPEYRR